MAILNPIFDYSLWIIFSIFVGVALALDLGVLTKAAFILKERLQTSQKKEKDELRKQQQQKKEESGYNAANNANTRNSGYGDSKQVSSPIPSASEVPVQGKKDSFPIEPAKNIDHNHHHQQNLQQSDTFKHALHWTIVWISLAIVFAGIIYFIQGYDNAILFLTGYAIEKSLSMDNMFVFLIIFSSLAIPYVYQHKVLMVGIISAIAMRIVLIVAGISLLETFHWMVYVFGGLLLFTAIRMIVEKKEKKIEIEKNIAVRILKKFVPITPELHGNKFLIRRKADMGKVVTFATPMLVALVIVEVTDLVFALDSIPAILAITTDTFIVITSNLFAILGLRSLYFLLAGMMDRFYYLKPGLAAILAFVGIKIILSDFYKIPIHISVLVIFSILGLVMVLSTIKSKKDKSK